MLLISLLISSFAFTPKELLTDGEWDVFVGNSNEHEPIISYSFEFHENLSSSNGKITATVWRSNEEVTAVFHKSSTNPRIAEFQLMFSNDYSGTLFYNGDKSTDFKFSSDDDSSNNKMYASLKLPDLKLTFEIFILDSKTIEIVIYTPQSTDESDALYFYAKSAGELKLAKINPTLKKLTEKRQLKKDIQSQNVTLAQYISYISSVAIEYFQKYQVFVYFFLVIIGAQIMIYIIYRFICALCGSKKTPSNIKSNSKNTKKSVEKKNEEKKDKSSDEEDTGNKTDDSGEEEEEKVEKTVKRKSE